MIRAVGAKKEVILDPLVPLKLIERQVAVPEADTRKASRIVQSRAVQRERTVRHGPRGDVDPLHQNAANRAIAVGDGLIYKIDVPLIDWAFG